MSQRPALLLSLVSLQALITLGVILWALDLLGPCGQALESWLLVVWPWNLLVTGSAVVAGTCCVAVNGVRLQPAAVLVGAGLWLLYWRALVPGKIAANRPGDIGRDVSIDCCASMLGIYHSRLCVALVVQIVRVASRRTRAPR
jgi:hypothetical protein